jgi:hypothetical protein
MALIQLNKNGGLRLNGRKAKRASRKSLAAAAGAVGVNTTKKVQKTVEEKLTKNELIAALRNKSTGTWTKKHGGGRKRVEGPMSMEQLIGQHLNEMRAHQGAGLAKRNKAANRRNATAARRAVKLAAHKKAVQERRNARKAETRAKKEAAAAERAAERATANAARAQAKKLAVLALANKRAARLSKLRASMEKVLSKKRTWSNSEVANLKLKLAKANKAANVTAVRKAASAYKKKYVRKAKEVAAGSLNAPKPKKAKKTNAQIAAAKAARMRKLLA